MSVREENRRNKNCPNRGLGIAAAAIGVGVGAALYYIFSKRTENPEEDGASSSWSAEHALHDASFSTISEHSTSDTSINSSSSEDEPNSMITRNNQSDTESDQGHSITDDDSYEDSYDSDQMFEHSLMHLNEQSSDEQTSDDDVPMSVSSFSEDGSIQSDDETNMEFDVTRSSNDVPTDQRSDQRSSTPMLRQFGELTVRLRNRVVNRERSWALEQCSICFDMMQREQEVVSLACTHRFHKACIIPWLEQQQTCPVCRKPS